MELGRFKDQIARIQDKLDELDPGSEEFETLMKRQNEIRRIIQDEETRRANEKLELEKTKATAKHDADEIAERKKDRWVKIGLGIGAGAIGIASIFADETRVACKSGLETIEKMRKITH